jgi:hypothetical protein
MIHPLTRLILALAFLILCRTYAVFPNLASDSGQARMTISHEVRKYFLTLKVNKHHPRRLGYEMRQSKLLDE